MNPHITIGEYGGRGFNEFGMHTNQYFRERDWWGGKWEGELYESNIKV